MKKNQAIAYIRQLCCLGLSKESVIAELLQTIKTVIPSDSNMFADWNDRPFPTQYIIDGMSQDALGVFLDAGEKIFTPDMVGNIARWHERNSVLDNLDIISERFCQSDLYNLVCRPCGQHHVLHGKVTPSFVSGSALSLCRPPTAQAFSSAEKNLFTRLLPYIQYAIQGSPGAGMEYTGNGETGLFVMDSAGRLMFASETARRLLSLTRYPAYPFGRQGVIADIAIPSALAQLCRNLDAVFRGGDVSPPTLTHINPRGRFIFRAHWLEPLNREPGGLVGVTVEHQEPTALRLLRGIKELPLSPVQMEVCLRLAQNHSQDSIAQRLHIKPSTVKDHVRKIYLKLDIHRRAELVGRLAAHAGVSRQRDYSEKYR